MGGLDNMQLICSERKPGHPATATTGAHAQSSAEAAGSGGENAAENEGGGEGGEEGTNDAEEGL